MSVRESPACVLTGRRLTATFIKFDTSLYFVAAPWAFHLSTNAEKRGSEQLAGLDVLTALRIASVPTSCAVNPSSPVEACGTQVTPANLPYGFEWNSVYDEATRTLSLEQSVSMSSGRVCDSTDKMGCARLRFEHAIDAESDVLHSTISMDDGGEYWAASHRAGEVFEVRFNITAQNFPDAVTLQMDGVPLADDGALVRGKRLTAATSLGVAVFTFPDDAEVYVSRHGMQMAVIARTPSSQFHLQTSWENAVSSTKSSASEFIRIGPLALTRVGAIVAGVVLLILLFVIVMRLRRPSKQT